MRGAVRLAPRIKQKAKQTLKILPVRLPALTLDKLNAKQKAAAAAICAGPRGDVRGPFTPMLRSPGLTIPTQALGAYIRWGVKLPFRLAEMAGLMAARDWSCQFEWTVHVPHALKGGLSAATIQALSECRRPDKMKKDEAIVYDFVNELLKNRGVSDTTYARAVKHFGEESVVDLIGVVGYYAMIAMLMNVARTPPPRRGEMTLNALPEYVRIQP
ncbi:MAG: carboxymuconolactone decarboxylase family protein [Betaproteobacteria bacterium]|nr:carboxymuconolactone decarboxylase family protein [Betaproteobacteria bacterium]